MQAAFDTVAQQYDHSALEFFNAIANEVIHAIPFESTSKMLDVATGTGKVALLAASQAPEIKVTGTDLSSGMLEQARQKAEAMNLTNVEFLQMDMENLDFPNNHFDVATCSAALHLLDDMLKGLQHITSKVKSGGKIIISAFDDDFFEPMDSMFFARYEAYGYQLSHFDLLKLVNDEQIETLFSQAGLKDVRIHRSVYQSPLVSFENWWHILWNTSYRDTFTSMLEQNKIKFKQEHAAEIQNLINNKDLSVKVSFAVASAIVP
jgi:ubiquinone/menaquinone biosynthesis C-methylase UbiE